MRVGRWVAVVGSVLVLAALGFGAALAAPKTQEATPPATPEYEDTPGRGFLGITIRPLNEKLLQELDLPVGTAGVVVTRVLPRSPALVADLRPRDVITAVDGGPVTTIAELKRLVTEKQRGDAVALTVLRDGQQLTISLTLGALPRPLRPPVPDLRHRLPILSHGLPGLVDGQFRVMEDGVVVTFRVANGTVVSGGSGTLTIEKATPEHERVSFTITPEAKILGKGRAAELSDLVGERVVVLERDGVVTMVAAGPAPAQRHHSASPPETEKRHGRSLDAREHLQRPREEERQPSRLERPAATGGTQEA